MFGYKSVQILMLTWSFTVAERNELGQYFQKNGPNAKLTEYADDFMNGTRNIMPSYGEMIRGLMWKKLVVFHDQSREMALKALLGSLENGISGFSPSMLKFEITHNFWGSVEETIVYVHRVFFPRIHIIVLCDERNTLQLLSQVMSVELKPRSLLDYRHNSYWLIFSDAKWVDRVMGLSASMENVAIAPLQHTKGQGNVIIHANQSCKVPPEDRYIWIAYGVNTARKWQWFSYTRLQEGIRNSQLLRLLYPNTMYRHNGRELRVAVRESLDCVYLVQGTKQPRYEGYCIDLFNDLLRPLNFSYHFVKPIDKAFGVKSKRTWSGVIGELQRGEADICVTHLYVVPEITEDLDFITPAFDVREYFILYRRNSRTVFSIFRFLEPFKMEVYIVLLSTLIIVPLMCFSAELIITGAPADNISEVVFYFCSSILQQGGRLKPVTWTARAITATFWLCSICLAAAYSAHLTACLTVTKNIQPFANIRELLQRSDYKVGSGEHVVLTALKTSKSGLHNELWERISKDSHNDPSIIGANMTNQMEKVLKGNYAVLVSDIFANRAVAIDCRVDYLKEIVAWNHLSFAVWKKSPFKHDLDKVMGRIVDSDFLQRYKEKHIKKQYNNSKLCEPIPRTTVSAEYMVGILSCLGIGFGASAFVILVEILYVKFKVASCISFLSDKVKITK